MSFAKLNCHVFARRQQVGLAGMVFPKIFVHFLEPLRKLMVHGNHPLVKS